MPHLRESPRRRRGHPARRGTGPGSTRRPAGAPAEGTALLREFVEHVPAAVAMFDREMRYIFVSRRWLEDYRIGDQDIIGRSHYEIFPEIPERWKELHRRALAGEVLRCEEDPFERADGTTDYVRWEIRPWYTGEGDVGGIAMFTEVITERKRAEDAIRASEARFRILSASSPVAIFEMDSEGYCTYVNPRWETITGMPAEKGLGYGWRDTIHPDDREQVFGAAMAGIRVGAESDREIRLLRPSGEVRWVRAHAAPITEAGAERITGFVGTLDDITAEKEAEEQLRASDERFMTLVNSNIVGIMLADMSGRIHKANDAFLEMVGYTRDDLDAGKVRWDTMSPPECAAVDRRALAELRSAGVAAPWEKEYIRKDGGRVPVLVGAARLGTSGDQTVAFALDLSERKRIESELRQRTDELEAIFHALPDLYFRVTPDGTILDYRAGRRSDLYVPPEEFLGKRVQEVVALEAAERLGAGLRQVVDTGSLVTVEYPLTIEGEERHFEARMLPLERGEIIEIVRDITEGKRAAESLRLIAEASRVLAASPDFADAADRLARLFVPALGDWCVIHVIDEEGKVRRAAVAQADPSRADLARRLMECPPPAMDRIEAAWTALRAGKTYLLTDLPDEILGMGAASAEHLAVLQEAGATSELMVPFMVRGHLTGWASFTLTRPGRTYEPPDIALAEEVARHVAQALDNARLYQEARDANAAKDQFLAVLSHELRNPLSPILTGVEVLRRTIPPDLRTDRTLALVERNVKLQARLISDLLDLSRIRRGKLSLQREPISLDGATRMVVESTQAEAGAAGLSLKAEITPGLWVLGDLDRLQQIVLNLLTNAIKFTPAGGEVRVRVDRGDGAGRVIVEDTGIGIDSALMPQLFEMFRQGEVGGRRVRGLGIGLALVKGLAELHGGRVWAESDGVGKGSRFTVELPLISAPEQGPAAPEVAPGPAVVLLLLVEDNADARELLRESLELMGYTVQAAESGEEALELLQSMRPDVIVADIGLPGMDGYEFLRRARQVPGLANVPAFAATGYGQEEDVARAQEAGFTDHLVKPVDITDLDRRIRALLQAP